MIAANRSNHSSDKTIENLLGRYFEMWLRALQSCRHSRHQATTDRHAEEWLECLGNSNGTATVSLTYRDATRSETTAWFNVGQNTFSRLFGVGGLTVANAVFILELSYPTVETSRSKLGRNLK